MKSDSLNLGSLDPLPSWLPDETLFSLCSRYHRLSGHGFSWQSTQDLFLHRTSGSQHDLPSRLDTFQEQTAGRCGSPDEIAVQRTLLRFYRPFSPQVEITDAIQSMRAASVAHLKFRLGLLTSRFRANHPLKACRRCMEADLESHGWVYWHLTHQFPGVWTCPSHGELLWVSTVKSTGVGRFHWTLPREQDLSCDWVRNAGPAAIEIRRLSQLIAAIIDIQSPNGWLEAGTVQPVLLRRILERDWMSHSGRLRLSTASMDFFNHCKPLRVVPELVAMPACVDDAAVQLGRLARPLRGDVHPLRLLVAIAWLFDDVEDFMGAYRSSAVPQEAGVDPGREDRGDRRLTENADSRRPQLLGLLDGGHTALSAATRLGVNVATAIAWATQAGISTAKRPKMLKPGLRSELVRRLSEGEEKADVASAMAVSVQMVTRVLRSEVGLHKAWKAARFNRSRDRARSTWLRAYESYGAAGVKVIRAMEPATYIWLYRHDIDWLREHTPPMHPQAQAPAKSPVHWDARDAQLSNAVRQAVLDLAPTGRKGRRLKLWQLYQAVPELKAKLSRLDRLPLTRRVIEAALEPHTSKPGQPDLFD